MMMNSIIRVFPTILILIGLYSTGTAQDWKTIQTFNTPQTITTIFTPADETVIAVSALYNGTDLNIKRSDDNGETWTEQGTGFTQMNFRGLASPDGQTIFAIGNAGALITNNGGDTWSTVDLGTTENLRSIFFLNEDVGYLGMDRGIIYQTVDGGETWVDMQANLQSAGSVSNIHFVNEDLGFVAGFNYMQVSYDGGENWLYVDGFEPAPGVLFQIQEIQFLNDSVGYICGDVGLMYKTTDGGATWTEQETGTTESLQDLKFINEDVGFACGFEATVIYTLDGGENWLPMTSDDTEHFRSIDVNSQRGFISTQRSKILALDGIPDLVSVLDFEPIEVSVFPNPTRDVVTYSTESTITMARLYDETGRELQTWELKAGEQQVDLSSHVSGTYFLGFFTEDNEGRISKVIKL
jgi:photosystem II stability/assembly factor-like uncharacterized protein